MSDKDLLLKYLLNRARVESMEIIIGIYFLFDGETIVYIGKSTDIHGRVHAHLKDPGKHFDRYAYIAVSSDDLDAAEFEYIKLFEPKYNRNGIPGRRARREVPKRTFIVHRGRLFGSGSV